MKTLTIPIDKELSSFYNRILFNIQHKPKNLEIKMTDNKNNYRHNTRLRQPQVDKPLKIIRNLNDFQHNDKDDQT